MTAQSTTLAGIQIPSSDPVFLSIVAIHVLLGITAVIAGATAMLSAKAQGRHPRAGSVYYWAIAGIFVSATALSIVRWGEDFHLFVLGAVALVTAYAGRTARRSARLYSIRLHILGMGASYILLLTAFYVDNGKQLPLWRELPTWTYWTLPSVAGIPLILWTVLRHPRVRAELRGRSFPRSPDRTKPAGSI